MIITAIVVAALSYLIGSLPLGYWLIKKNGYHPREVSAHNLGIENVMRLLGPGPALLSGLSDVFKVFIAISLAVPTGQTEIAVLAGFAAYMGHLFPPKQFFPDVPPRGRGNLALLGVLAGWSAAHAFPELLIYLTVAVFAGLLAYTRFVVVATLSALGFLALMVTLFTSIQGEYKFLLWIMLGVAVWRLKEQLGRIMDRTEPRLGEKIPMRGKNPNERVAAFMIHALTPEDMFQTERIKWLKPYVDRGLIPIKWVVWAAEQLRPVKVDELRGIKTSEGIDVRMYLITCPVLPEFFRDKPEMAVQRAIQGARLAHELGASVFGLGAFWSTVGNKGLEVQEAVPEIHITNGGAYTAGTVKNAIPGILKHFAEQGRNLKEVTAGVVGANGVVAFGIARTISPQVGKVILLGRDMERLERSMKTLAKANPSTEFTATLDYASLKTCDIIFTATSDPDPVIFPEHVKENTWIFDEGRPADVDESVKQIPGVRVIPGGVVVPPGSMTGNVNLHFGKGAVPACLAETLIIAATESYDRKSLGQQTLSENINFFVQEAERLGFLTVEE
ncbi:glycerol-3-phosphate acyltransferase [Deinococcus misasensis]|uniref:glycerol-3-phosphate acyltransferase n=1 Tax=Deinococcus misasensis TaxID=392413 RepID=UPI000555B762|nr:glycerol-3-phosphate acyltransferase [Deinococcus misasensis]